MSDLSPKATTLNLLGLSGSPMYQMRTNRKVHGGSELRPLVTPSHISGKKKAYDEI